MAKKAAKTVSWRTLARRAKAAEKKGHKAVATRLHNMAAEARRSERRPYRVKKGELVPVRNLGAAKRAAKGWAERAENEIMEAAAAAAFRAQGGPEITGAMLNDGMRGRDIAARQAAGAVLGAGGGGSAQGGLPGHGEIVGGADAQAAERIVKLARKRGGTDAVQNEIMSLRQIARYDGASEADRNAIKRLAEVQENITERVVCGFIAEVDDAVKFHAGLPRAMTWQFNSFTITKIVDALNKAGYRANGKT